ncbi:MAG: hypothetical protein AAF958_02010 [Planctomycetota bacterium]
MVAIVLSGTACDRERELAKVKAERQMAAERLAEMEASMVSGSPIPEVAAEKLGELGKLRSDGAGRIIEVDFRSCAFPPGELKWLADLPNIKILRFGGQSPTPIDDRAFQAAGDLPSLKVLAVDGQEVSACILDQLAKPENLVEFYAAKTPFTEDAGCSLAILKGLKKLRIAQTQIDYKTLVEIGRLPALVDLDASGNPQLDSGDIAMLSDAQSLEKLNLYDTGIDGQALQTLGKLPNIKWLNLDKTNVDDDSLEALAGLQNIEFLHLGSTPITDDAADALTQLKSLKRLIVTRTKMTQTGVDKILQALPECDVQWVYESDAS